MVNEFWLSFSAVLLVCGIVTAAAMVVFWLANREAPRLLNGWAAMALVVAAALAYYLPINIHSGGQWHEIIDEFISSILEVGRVLQGENDLEHTRAKLDVLQLSPIWQRWFGVYTAVMHVAMSAALVGLIYKAIRRLFAESFLSHTFRRKAYIFSTISERTLLLAEDIYGKDRSASLIFLNKNDSGRETDLYMMSRVRNIRGKVLSSDSARLQLPRYFLLLKEEIEFFLFDENETENCFQAFDLIRKYKDNAERRTVVNLLVHSPEAVTMIDKETEWKDGAAPSEHEFIVRPIDEYGTMVRQLADTRPFFLGRHGDRLTILVVGAGGIGMAAVKIASWCAHTLELKPEILVVDSDPRAERRFAAECPELYANTDDEVSIKFFTCDITGDEFVRFAEEHPEVGYAVVSLGDDILSLHAGRVLRTVFEQHRLKDANADPALPLINVKVRDRVFSEKTSSMEDERDANMRNLHPFGSLDSIYRYDTITNLPLDRGGARVKEAYGKSVGTEEEQWRSYWRSSQYDRNSSTASALHAKYKAYAILVEELGEKAYDEPEWWTQEKLSGEIIEKLAAVLEKYEGSKGKRPSGLTDMAKLEHRRWNAYMRANGWRRATNEQIDMCYKQQLSDGSADAGEKPHKIPAARLHGSICPWEELDALNKFTCKGDKNDIRNSDYDIVIELPAILRAIAGGA